MKRISRLTFCLAACAALAAAPVSAQAPDAPAQSLMPADAVWGVVIDANHVRGSALAKQTLDHLSPDQRDGLLGKLDGVSNMLGVNLREDLNQIVVFGHSFEPRDMAAAIDIGQAQSNLEGLLLAAEGYDSYDYGDLLVHSFMPNPDEPRIYCAVVPGSEGAAARRGVVLISPAADRTEKLIDQAWQGVNVADPAALGPNEFMRLWINELPAEMFGQGSPPSNIVSMIQSMQLVGTTDEKKTALSLSVATSNPARARQIFQMASGGKAFIEFAASSDPDAAKLADLLSYISIENPDGGPTVSIKATADTDDFKVLLDLLGEQGVFDNLAE